MTKIQIARASQRYGTQTATVQGRGNYVTLERWFTTTSERANLTPRLKFRLIRLQSAQKKLTLKNHSHFYDWKKKAEFMLSPSQERKNLSIHTAVLIGQGSL